MESEKKAVSSWLDVPLASVFPKITVESLIIVLILALAVVSRFAILGNRVMSHDEINHVVPSWELYQGRTYAHDPVTHGPMQFHLVALSYFLFGDNDFTSRIPAAVFSIATVAFTIFGFRRYLGRLGSIIAGLLMCISPYVLFYGRYTRNEAFVGLFFVVTFYAVLRYLEKGDKFSLFLLTATTALHFCTKETSYIFTAILLIFLGLLFMFRMFQATWHDENKRKWCYLLIAAAFIFMFLALSMWVIDASATTTAAIDATDSEATEVAAAPITLEKILLLVFVVLTGVSGVWALVLMAKTLGWETIRKERSFDLIILIGSLILPLLTALPVSLVGWDPIDYSTNGIIHTSIFLVVMIAAAILLGWWWNLKAWISHVIVFYTIFGVLYTTFFTNGVGFFTGLVGSLGYWASQQGVERGSQPWYYFALIQIPIYEFLPALGALLAMYFGIKHNRFMTIPGVSPASPEAVGQEMDEAEASTQKVSLSRKVDVDDVPVEEKKIPVLIMFLFWSVASLVAYSIAGEKMPWITVHIAVPMILAAGWGLGYLLDTTDWKRVAGKRHLLGLLLIPVFFASFSALIGSLFGNNPPFQGNELDQLRATSTFIFAALFAPLSGYGVVYFLLDLGKNKGEGTEQEGEESETQQNQNGDVTNLVRLLGIALFAVLAIITARSAYRASYINYDTAKEYLVYAHAAAGPKEILKQVEEISRRITGGLDIEVAYDNNCLYPYWWYFRDYPNHRYYAETPTRDLKDVPIILASSDNYSKLDSIVKDNYISYDYMRLWWPNQDYFNLTWDRIWYAISDPNMRAAIFDIWLNRDYTLYASLTGSENLTLENWQPSDSMRLYIRKDIIAQIWNYGASPSISVEEEEDPYLAKMISLLPDVTVGATGTDPGMFNQPRGVAVAEDGSVYVADSRNNRIQHFAADGSLLNYWGSTTTSTDLVNDPQPGTFTEPWGIAVGPDGSVYVADTWNYRIQKFTADGEFVMMWGYSGQGTGEYTFYGPRGVAVDSSGRVYITDTGNKRVVVYTADGEYVTSFGTAGMDVGQLDEPVGIALNQADTVYLADTWNQRIQSFTTTEETGTIFVPSYNWEVYGWFSTSLDNKPFLTVDPDGNVFITDPEGYRVLEFSAEGEFIQGWGEYSAAADGFGLPSGIASDKAGGVWVSDAANNLLLHFTLP